MSPSREYAQQFINGALLGPPQPLPMSPGNASPGGDNSFNLDQSSFPRLREAEMPDISAQSPKNTTFGKINLYVQTLPEKSRVETQIPVTLALHPLPACITKIHLPTYTISKSKLLAKPTPEKSCDMLELHVMLVSTTAMQNRNKRMRAAAEAIKFEPQAVPGDDRRSSSAITTPSEEDESRPMNGGPVQICKGCIERERKRAGRKKTKNKEEEEEWLKDEAKRTIVFNTHEVKEWQHASSAKNGKSTGFMYDPNAPPCPKDALQVDLPMRITCYCRHQEEKLGFQ